MFDSVKEVKFSTIVLVAVMVGTVMVVTWWMLVPESAQSGSNPALAPTVEVPVSPEPETAPSGAPDIGGGFTGSSPGRADETADFGRPAHASGSSSAVSEFGSPATEGGRADQVSLQASPSGRFAVQAGSFSQEAGAIRRQAELQAEGFPTFIQEGMAGGKRVYRLYIGKFPTRSEAARAMEQLKARGVECFVKELS